MNTTAEWTDELAARYREIHDQRMRELPIVNAALDVETMEFRQFGKAELGVLLTPWFMNLVLIQSNAVWSSSEQGTIVSVDLPGGTVDFTVARDESIGAFLSAVLFRTVADFPDQDTAREIAAEVMRRLFEPRKSGGAAVSRRDLLTGLGQS